MRPIEDIVVWEIDAGMAERLATRLTGAGLRASTATDLEAAVADADIVSCATLATEPLIRSAWLKAGQHLDLIGSFTPGMREADDDAVRRARVYIETEVALKASGDLIAPIETGALTEESTAGDLFGLCQGTAAARGAAREITLFKATGTALADLAAASLAHTNSARTSHHQ